MKEDTKYLCCAGALAGCLLVSTNCFAEGKIIIHPKVQTGITYNSNYWQAEEQEVAVNTYFVKPGIDLGFETPKTKINLDATLDAYWYDDLDTPPVGIRDAGEDDYVGFTGLLSANHQLSDRLNLDLTDEMYVTRDPAQSDVSSNSTNRDKYTINHFSPGVYYEFADKFGLLTRYRSTVTDYEKELEDSNEHRGIFDLFYNLNSRSSVFVDYSVWQRNYDQDSADYLSNQVTLNYQTKLKYFSILGGGGYHNRSFDADSAGNDLDDLDMFSWKIQVNGQDADDDSTKKIPRSRISLAIGQEMNDDGTGDQYFTSTFARFQGGYRLFSRLEALLDADYQNSDYETENREDDTYSAAAGLKYQALDNIALGVRGGVETRDSNLDGRSYDDYFVGMTLDVAYDFGSR